MSHVETVAVTFTDLVAFEAACKRLGAEFRKNQTMFEAYNRSKCVHAVHVPGCNYELGLVQNADKKSYSPQLDYYSDGIKLQHMFCKRMPAGQVADWYKNYDHGDPNYTKGFEKLTDAYSVEVVKRKAYAKGMQVFESVMPDGGIKIVAQAFN